MMFVLPLVLCLFSRLAKELGGGACVQSRPHMRYTTVQPQSWSTKARWKSDDYSNDESVAVPKKRVMLWTTNTLAFTNVTERVAWVEELKSVQDVVDVISPGSYYASATWPHRLMRFPGATEVHSALQAAGFKVQPLVGGIGGSWQSAVFGSTQFIADASKEIKTGGLEGLNFDWEPSTCATESDSFQYADFIRRVKAQSGGFVTVTFPCLHNACDPVVLTKVASRVIDMQTYGGGGVNGTWSPEGWQHVLQAHVAAVGSMNYGLGVCPSCCMNPPLCNHPLSTAEIATRLRLADVAGVYEVDVFADVEPRSDPYNSSRIPVRSSMAWWTALRKWKERGPVTFSSSRMARLLNSSSDHHIRRVEATTGNEIGMISSRMFPAGVRFIAAANDSHCIPGEAGAIWLEQIMNHTRYHVGSCATTCRLPKGSGPCCNITRVPCAYIASLQPGGPFSCANLPPPTQY